MKVNTKDKLTVNTSAKGKIDTIQRQNGVTYTIKSISKVGYDADKLRDTIQSAELVNIAGKETVTDKFTANTRWNETTGKMEVVVCAKENAVLSTKTAYQFMLKFKVDGLGEVCSKKLTIKPKQSAIKTAVSGDTTLYNNLNSTGTVRIRITKPQGVDIDKIVLEKSAIPKGMTVDESKIVINGDSAFIPYQLTTDASEALQAGKSYKLKCMVTPKGMAVDKKPQTVSVKFVVKK